MYARGAPANATRMGGQMVEITPTYSYGGITQGIHSTLLIIQRLYRIADLSK